MFDNVRPTKTLAQEEVFGPVLAVFRVNDFEEAMKIANNVQFGLTCAIYTSDANLVMRFTDRIEAGMVHINSPTVGGEAQLPFGGYKATGLRQPRNERGRTEFLHPVEDRVLRLHGRETANEYLLNGGGTMARIVRGGLIQATNPEPGTSTVKKIKQAMIEKHIKLIDQAAKKGVQVLCMQEIFYGPVLLLRAGGQMVRVNRARAGRSDRSS